MRKHITFFLLSSLLFSLHTMTLHAQKPRLYNVEHGLASTQLTDLDFDQDNFLWVSTRGGLSRFDGQSFITFTGESDDTVSLNSNMISCSYVSDDGFIWIGANDGLYRLDHATNRFTYFPLDEIPDHIVSVSAITNIEEYPDRLLVGTNGYGIFVFDMNKLTVDQELTQAFVNAYSTSYITSIINDDRGTHWISSLHWVTALNPKSKKIVVPTSTLSKEEQQKCEITASACIPNKGVIYFGTAKHGLLECKTSSFEISSLPVPELSNRQITSIASSSDTTLLIGTEGQGLWSLNTRTLATERIRYTQCPVDLDHVKIKNIAFDKQGNTWYNLYQKGIMVVPTSGKLFSCQPILANLQNEHNLSNVSSFSEGPDHTRCFGLDGAGVLMLYPDGSRRLYSSENSILNTSAIMTVKTLPDGRTYIGTYGDGMYVIDRSGKLMRDPNLSRLDPHSIMCLELSRDKQSLYIGTNGEGLYSYDLNEKQLNCLVNDDGSHWVISLFAGDPGQIWFGTEGQIMRYTLSDGSVTRYKEPYHVRAFTIAKDADEALWFLTDKGLYRFYKQDQTIREVQIGQQMGETYSAMLIADDGKLWLSSNMGIISYDPKYIKILRYNSPDISEVGSFSIRASQRWSDRKFGFGGDNGMLVFDPTDVESYDYELAPVYFTRLWVNNQQVDYNPSLSPEENLLDSALWAATTLKLPIESNSFSLSFTVQEYSTPVYINYSYRLNGYEDQWHQVQGLNQTLSYASLPAGTYTLEVSAQQGNDQNSQPQTKELKIIIKAPWYQSSWFTFLIGLLFAASMFWSIWTLYKTFTMPKSQKTTKQ